MTVHRTCLVLAVVSLVSASTGCATFGSLSAFVRAPRFEEVPSRPAEIRLLPPSAGNLYGGAGVRLWTQVTNPNGFGITLSRLDGSLFVEEARAAAVDLPLGLPLEARGESVIPIDLAISFADLPGVAEAVRRAAGNEAVGYRLEATVGVDAGRFGQPEFGPMTVLRGDLRAPRVLVTVASVSLQVEQPGQALVQIAPVVRR